MPKAAAVRAGRGFIVKYAGDWFRVPRRLVKSGVVETRVLVRHNTGVLARINARRAVKGKPPLSLLPKAAKRDLFMGNTPGRNSSAGDLVRQQMKDQGRYEKDMYGVERFLDTSGVWQLVQTADMGHKVSAVDFWNKGAPPKYPMPGRLTGPRSTYVRKFMQDGTNYEFQLPGSNRSAGAVSDNYLDPV